jgi:hypothetical protein
LFFSTSLDGKLIPVVTNGLVDEYTVLLYNKVDVNVGEDSVVDMINDVGSVPYKYWI